MSHSDETRVHPATPAEVPDPLVGSLFANRYRIVRLLGVGAMGAVYLADHLMIRRRDAIKILNAAFATDAQAVTRFERGTRNVAAIRHPNVCTIYDFGDTESGQRFLAMEYVAGESLSDLLKREGPLPLDRCIDIALQVASALEAAHLAGVVHRDLKPANIMIAKGPAGEDHIKVVDFDISKGTEEDGGEEVTRIGYVVGTPGYMSPEQLAGEELDGRSDIYALGLVLYRMLTGGLPFRGTTETEMVRARLTDAPLRRLSETLPNRAFPPEVQAAIDRALVPRKHQRIASAGEFASLLRALQKSEPSDNASAPTRVYREERRRPGTLGAQFKRPAIRAAAGVVVLLGGLGGGLIATSDAPEPSSTAPEPAAPPAAAAVTFDVTSTDREGVSLNGGITRGADEGSLLATQAGALLYVTRAAPDSARAAPLRGKAFTGDVAALLELGQPEPGLRVQVSAASAETVSLLEEIARGMAGLDLVRGGNARADLFISVAAARSEASFLAPSGDVRAVLKHVRPNAEYRAALMGFLRYELALRRFAALDHRQASFRVALSLSGGQRNFAVNDEIRFHIRSDKPGHLTLLELSTDGSVNIHYPSPHFDIGTLTANEDIEIPGAYTPLMFLASPPAGLGLVRVIVSETPLELPPGKDGEGLDLHALRQLLLAAPSGTWATTVAPYTVRQ